MKYTRIFILVDTNYDNLSYPSTITVVKSEIVKYFGTKNVFGETTTNPDIFVLGEVSSNDLNKINDNLGTDFISLFAIIVSENYKFKENILDLS